MALGTAACASTRSPEAAAVREADARMVEGCRFLGEVTGSSPGARQTGIWNAKSEALEQAAKLKATHVVWGTVSGNVAGASASGKAYACPQ